MNLRSELIDRLRSRAGSDPADIVDELYGNGVINDSGARRYLAPLIFTERFGSCDRSARSVMEEVADELGIDRSQVHRLVRDTHQNP